MISAGTTLQQRYKIDKQIGQGGMGAVYVATDERFGSTVAIKETLAMDDNFRKAIEREARLLNSLKHPALPRVSDHFEEENSQFLVMEYIPGEDVGHILDRQEKPFEVDQVLKWADELLDALDYLHSQDNPVVHRDIKPQNLKITPRGEIILLDFGLAKGNPTDAGHQTAAKSIFGYSRNYASLEQIQGTGTDPRSDLYALAATLYHLLTNQVPEDALTRAMAVLSGRPDPLIPASTINPAVPRGVAGVLQCAMALNADDRPAHASNMRDMLRQNGNFAYLIENIGAGGAVTSAAPRGQPTAAIASPTVAAAMHNGEAKTEVLPAYISQPTAVNVQGGGEVLTTVGASHHTAAPPRRRSFLAIAIAGAAAIMLGGGAVAGGLYLLGPASAADQSVQQMPANTSTASNSASNAPQSQPAGVGVTSGSSTASSAPPSTTAETHQSQQPSQSQPSQSDKQTDTAKTEKPPKPPKSDTTVTDLPDPDIPTIKVDKNKGGDMVITQRDENGNMVETRIPMPKRKPGMPPPGYDPFPPGTFDPRVMTPEQKRTLQEMIRRNQQIRRNARPTPSPNLDHP